jgi:hypothetical protein
MKPVLDYIAREELAGDSVYLHYTAQLALATEYLSLKHRPRQRHRLL